MRIRQGSNYSCYGVLTQKQQCRRPSQIWTHSYRHRAVCIFMDVFPLARWFLTDFICKIEKGGKETERERGGLDCMVSWDHGDYACGHWLPSLSTPKVCRIWINEVGMLSSCQTHAGCCLVMPAEYRQRVLDRRQHRKFNLENTGHSLMRHQPSLYRLKWAHWQCMTLISLKTTWQGAQHNAVQTVEIQYVGVQSLLHSHANNGNHLMLYMTI